MKTRSFQVIWALSTLWLVLIIYGGINKDQLLLNLIVFGWPSAIGFVASFIATGTFMFPKESSK